MLGAGIGLNNGTMNYLEGSIRAEYHQLINSKLQFSARWEGRYTSTVYESLWTRYGPGNIRGIEYGDLSGPLMQLASTGLYYTWLNCDYLAMEQSVFVQYAAAMVNAGDWSSVKRHYAIGTGFQFTIPMYPAASLLLTFSFNPNRKNWFYLEL
jgi:hemolysin activation/secretion protein